jgi:hypothetical protein
MNSFIAQMWELNEIIEICLSIKLVKYILLQRCYYFSNIFFMKKCRPITCSQLSHSGPRREKSGGSRSGLCFFWAGEAWSLLPCSCSCLRVWGKGLRVVNQEAELTYSVIQRGKKHKERLQQIPDMKLAFYLSLLDLRILRKGWFLLIFLKMKLVRNRVTSEINELSIKSHQITQ